MFSYYEFLGTDHETVFGNNSLSNEGELTIRDLVQVQHDVFEARSAWYDIGLSLGIMPDTLTAIKRDNPESKDSFREMLACWLKSATLQKSWKALINALKEEVVGYPNLAKTIAEKHNV